MTKRLFYPLFRDAWKEAFTLERIEHAFDKTGIWLYDSEKVLGLLRKPTTNSTSSSPNQPRTPLSCHAIRRTHRQYRLDPTKEKLEVIFRSHERLAAQDSINKHVISSLQRSIQIEQKKRKKGKRLNIVGEEDNGPQFFTPGRVRAAIEYQAQKEDQEEVEKQAKIDNKARKALEKEEKEARKKLALEERLRKRAEAESEKVRKARERTEKAAKRKAEARKRELYYRLQRLMQHLIRLGKKLL